MKYELSIDASYLDDDRWDAAAGIREFLQNGRDAAIEHDAPLVVTHRDGVLVIENEGAKLSRDSLLLGRSTKRDRQDELAGKWGEGLKLGALALIRAGFKVKIRNGGEVWVPSIEASEKFAGRDVLVFNVETGRQERDRVRVEISHVTAADWEVLKEHYLFLRKGVKDSVQVDSGALLLGEKQKGCVYVKGILVQRIADLAYGYDLNTASLDRDRRMIEHYDLRAKLRDIWYEATATRPDLIAKFSDLLDAGAVDVEGISDWNASNMPTIARQQIAQTFATRHGADAVPVDSLADSKDIEHLGKKGIIVKKQLRAVLESVVGSLDTVKRALANEAIQEYAWGDLTAIERANLESAIALVQVVEPVKLADVHVVDFRNPTLLGQFSGNTISLARRILVDRSETLATLVHEVAHQHGGDGDKGHVAQLETIWAKIVENLRAR